MSDALRDELRAAILARNAVVITGAGVSIQASGNPEIGGCRVAGWEGLLRHGVQRCKALGMSDGMVAALTGLLDEGQFLTAAELITEQLGGTGGGEFSTWLEETVGRLTLRDPAVPLALRDLQVPLLTTNYDALLEEATQRPALTWLQGSRWQLAAQQPEVGIVHLHGSYDHPQTVVLGVRSYESVLRDPGAQNALRALASTRSLVFVGFGAGIADPNFGGLRTFLSTVLPDARIRHYRIVPDEEVEKARAEHRQEERIVPLGHGPGHASLAGFLRTLAPPAPAVSLAASRPAQRPRPVLEVEISSTQVAASVPGQDAVTEDLGLDKLRLETVRLLDEWLRFQEDQRDAERSTQSHVATILGSILFDSVFTGKVRDLYRDQVRSASPEHPLSIVLKVRPQWLTRFGDVEPLALTSLPWELLYDHEEKGCLSTASALTLSRVYYGARESPGWEAPQALRVLVALAQPEELVQPVREEWDADPSRPESYDQVVQNIVDTVRRVQSRDAAASDAGIGMSGADEPATCDRIKQALSGDEPPHIVHYIGHGRVRGSTGYLAFARQGSEQADWRTFTDFALKFDPEKPPILVFLHLCQGPRSLGTEQGGALARGNFSPLAFELIKRQVKMVVAMQYPASPDTGRAFTARFYEDIKSKTVAEAVQSARKTVMDQGVHVGGPVLYLRGKDGVILSQSMDQGGPGAAGQARHGGAETVGGTATPPPPPRNGQPATEEPGNASPGHGTFTPAAQQRTVLQPAVPVNPPVPAHEQGAGARAPLDGVIPGV